VTVALDLNEWRDAAVRGAFPRPGRTERWQPLRAGVVNLWEYDVAEIWYADGHVQLQGANESGKSTLMALTTLLLLAGDTSSTNIDTLGQGDKRFRYYVEPTGHALDRRDAAQSKHRGWAWLEFGSSGSGSRADEYFTLLLFAESRRPDNDLTLQWCTAYGSARVRDGLTLVTAGVVGEPKQLRDLPGFTAHPSGAAYREEIARTLYGTDLAWLDQLVRILRVVRTPHIGQRLDLRFLTTAIRHALPPIAQDEIDQLANGWEQLQRLRNERDATDQALAAVTEFNRQRWRPWADSVIRAAADPVAAITSRLTQITREEKAASDAVSALTRESAELDGRISRDDQAMQLATEQRDALHESKAYDDARAATLNAQQLADRAGAAHTTAERSRKRADQALEAIAPAESRLATARKNLEGSELAENSAASTVAGHAEGAGLLEVTARHLPGRDTQRLQQAARLRSVAAAEALRRIRAHAKAVTAYDTAASKARDARLRADRAQREAAVREEAIETALTAVVDLLADWASTLDARLRPSSELLENWTRQVSALADADQPSPVLTAVVGREFLTPARRPLDKLHAELESALKRNLQDRAAAEAELAIVEALRDPRPRGPELWARRERPEGVSAIGAPLWRLVETVSPDVPVAALEAAMDAAGLLQAWITPDGMFVRAREGSDIVWTLTESQPRAGFSDTAESLIAVLRPADDADSLAPAVDRLLRSVSYGADLPSEGTALSEDGRWRHGNLVGLAEPAPGGARLLGAAARAADRARHIGELCAKLDRLAGEGERLTAELAEIQELLAGLDAAADRVPGDTDVVAAVLGARNAARVAETAVADADAADDAEKQARLATDNAATEVAVHCTEHDLPRASEAVEQLQDALTGYQAAIGALVSAISLLQPMRDAAEQAAATVDQLRDAHENTASDAASDEESARALRARANAARAALTKEAQEILDEVGRLTRQIEETAKVLKRLRESQNDLAKRKLKAELTLEQVAGRREEAEVQRQKCVDQWLGCVDSGLPRLRGLDDPPARHVTAALESVRVARAKITPRDWPDDPDAAMRRVQVQWQRMTEAVAELRSRLETLAGRTVRAASPGEGSDVFPGAVEIVVDATGAAFDPPTAAATLDVLLRRLQSEYDEELTRTINELLGSTFIEHLRDRLAESERLRSDINAKLAHTPTSVSGLTLRLVRVPVAEERAANDVLVALERDFDLLPEAVRGQLRQFLADRVSDAQQRAKAASEPDWRKRLVEVLDYRQWFEMRLEYHTPRTGNGASGSWRALDRGDHGLLSQGAKVVTLMQPFIAALHAMYDQSSIGPRMIWLDEAFGGVDSDNKAALFRLLTSCDMDWLIAGPSIIANSATVPLAAIYEVRRAPKPLPGVSLELAVWSGSDLTHIPTPDPADLLSIGDDRHLEAADLDDLLPMP
jgi:uncharacterized protein (TIGR02680 family)